MVIEFTERAALSVGTADGVTTREFEPGEVVNLFEDTALVFVGSGLARPTKKKPKA